MVGGAGGGVHEPGQRLIKSSQQWTPAQVAFLDAEAERLGLQSRAAVARLIVQAAMSGAEGICPTCGQEWRR